MRRICAMLPLPVLVIAAIAMTARPASAQICYTCAIIINGPTYAGDLGGHSAAPLAPEGCAIQDDIIGQEGCVGTPGGHCELFGDFCNLQRLTVAGTGFYPSQAEFTEALANAHAVEAAGGRQLWLGCKGSVIKRTYARAAGQAIRERSRQLSI